MDKKHQQDALPKHATPALRAADVKKKAEALDGYEFSQILTYK